MPQIDKVPNMKKRPSICMVCGTTPHEDGEPKPAIDLNTDIDWGQNAYLCAECVEVICDLWERVSVEDHEAVKRDFRVLAKQHKRLRDKFQQLESDYETLIAADKVKKRRAA